MNEETSEIVDMPYIKSEDESILGDLVETVADYNEDVVVETVPEVKEETTECTDCKKSFDDDARVNDEKMKQVFELWVQMGKVFDKCLVCGAKDELTAHPWIESKLNLTVDNRYMTCPKCKVDKRLTEWKPEKYRAAEAGKLLDTQDELSIRTLSVALRRNCSITKLM